MYSDLLGCAEWLSQINNHSDWDPSEFEKGAEKMSSQIVSRRLLISVTKINLISGATIKFPRIY